MAESECSRLAIERLSTGDLFGAALEKVEFHLRTCPSCGAYRAQLEQARQEFLRLHPFADLKAVGATKKSGELWYERLLAAVSIPLVRPVLIPACVALLAAIMILPFTGRVGIFTIGLRPDVSYKGTEQPLSYIYKRGNQVRESSPDDMFRPGDKIQIFYDSRKEQFLTLLSISTEGNISFYHPEAALSTCSIRTGTGKRLAYPVSIELDSSAGSELIVGLFSEGPFDTTEIKGWIAALPHSGNAASSLEKIVKERLPRKQSSAATLTLQKE